MNRWVTMDGKVITSKYFWGLIWKYYWIRLQKWWWRNSNVIRHHEYFDRNDVHTNKINKL